MQDEMGQTTSTHESLKMHTKVLENLYGRDHLKTCKQVGVIKHILKDTQHKGVDSVAYEA